MKLSGIYNLTLPTITDDDAAALAAQLDLTAATGSADAAFLKKLLARAVGAVEKHVGRTWHSCSLRAVFSLNSESSVELPTRPVTAVTTVTLNGETVTGWTLAPVAGGVALQLPAAATGELVVDFTAGYADPVKAPPEFEAAIMAVAADMYEHREAQSEVNLSENRNLRFVLAALNIPLVG